MLCHVCKANIEEQTPGFGVSHQLTTSTTFAWFTEIETAKVFAKMLSYGTSGQPYYVWDLCLGSLEHIYWAGVECP